MGRRGRQAGRFSPAYLFGPDPLFMGSAYLRESLPASSPPRDDDKVYFFFSESGKEFNFFEDTIVSRIARVCKGDVGGERVLQRRWTTFLKAQLLCAPPEGGFPFNVLQDIFVLTPGGHWPQTTFYGVFTSQWGRRGAAVCAFPVADVRQAFNGLYKEVNRETQQWYTDTRPVMEPRPGACIGSRAHQMKISSSLQMPDRVLNYLKDHFLMNSAVRSHPLLLCSRSRCRQISVQRVQGLHRAYDVLFLGTGKWQAPSPPRARLRKAAGLTRPLWGPVPGAGASGSSDLPHARGSFRDILSRRESLSSCGSFLWQPHSFSHSWWHRAESHGTLRPDHDRPAQPPSLRLVWQGSCWKQATMRSDNSWEPWDTKACQLGFVKFAPPCIDVSR
ncbi:Semaphorin-4B [Varanus komodoensis]|nr:Semaphorin-4B [Varanus komodoensis]